MKVVILCGGRGTRLRPETEFRPKPMVPVGDRPILIHIMESFARYGFKEFVLCLGYKGEIIRNYFLNFPAMSADFTVDLGTGKITSTRPSGYDWRVTLVNTGIPTGTGGRIKRAAHCLDGQSFFMTYGDGMADVDLSALLSHHKRLGRLATVTGVHPASRFGVIESKDGESVDGFREKPLLEGLVSGGFFVFEPGVLDYLDDDCVLEEQPLQSLAKDRQLALYKHQGFFLSMDTYRDYLQLNELFDAGLTPWISDGSH
ncbi:MAG: glucose-1-phosphate cytidylyltransferase [Planctomycetes bacterium]|nr:glucose-1-phosphate cytidylyltransferase [Planctomycetota bacterium]